MGDYHDLYLKAYNILLAVFEKFIGVGIEYYGLDLSHYFSSPGQSCDAKHKVTGAELGPISDIDMYLFVEKSNRRGGIFISYIVKRYSKANKKFMI